MEKIKPEKVQISDNEEAYTKITKRTAAIEKISALKKTANAAIIGTVGAFLIPIFYLFSTVVGAVASAAWAGVLVFWYIWRTKQQIAYLSSEYSINLEEVR